MTRLVTSVYRASQRVAFTRRLFSLYTPAVTVTPVQNVIRKLTPQTCRFFSVNSTTDNGKIIDFLLADIGEGIAECEVLKWFVQPGQRIQQFDKVCEVQSDKANVEITSRYDGVVRELMFDVGQMAHVGKPLMKISVEGTESKDSSSAEPSNADSEESTLGKAGAAFDQAYSASEHSHNFDKVKTSPAVRHLAREHKVNLTQVPATGPHGRILKEDVLKFIKHGKQSMPQPSHASIDSAASMQADTSKFNPPSSGYLQQDQVVPVSGIQRVMVQTMNAANAIPTFLFGDEIIVDQLAAVREHLKSVATKRGVKLSFLPFIIKATSLALKQYPSLNASVAPDCSSVTHRADHNIGLAMDTPRGLLVPNIKRVQDKSILEIAAELNRLAALGAAGKLGKSDLTDGTFTLSNIGSVGGTYMVPILVVPEVMIGALGSIQTLPRYDINMNVKPTKVMNISWTGDHRVLDGATTARFSNLFKSYLEQPTLFLAEMH